MVKVKKTRIAKCTYKICEEERHIRKTSPWDQVSGLQYLPNLLLLMPHRDASTADRTSMYNARLVCCVLWPVKSIEGPAIKPARRDLHFAVLKLEKQNYLWINLGDRKESSQFFFLSKVGVKPPNCFNIHKGSPIWVSNLRPHTHGEHCLCH